MWEIRCKLHNMCVLHTQTNFCDEINIFLYRELASQGNLHGAGEWDDQQHGDVHIAGALHSLVLFRQASTGNWIHVNRRKANCSWEDWVDFALLASAVDQECVGRNGTVEVGAGQTVRGWEKEVILVWPITT